MAFVLDASVTAVWAFDDEDHPVAGLARQSLLDDPAYAPSLWWFELRNTLIVNERRKRITEMQVASFLETLARLPIQLDFEPNEYAVGYLVALIDQKKNSEHHFLRGKGTLDSAKLGGLAKSATTKAKTKRTMTELLRLVSAGHSVSRASELAFKNGFGSSTMANKKIWSRNFKK